LAGAVPGRERQEIPEQDRWPAFGRALQGQPT
jgi:hypothetical protein